MSEGLQDLAMAVVDRVMAIIPQPVPELSALQHCKIISHRGEHDNSVVMENTLLAFDNARAAGVWGIECDIRWTSDNVPVICHDATASRVFGQSEAIAELSFATLRERLPAIPSLQEVLERFGGNTHLMLELKSLSQRDLGLHRHILQQHLQGLVSGRDFHILSLDASLFTLVDFLGPAACLPVAQANVAALSRLSLERGYSGLAGHYLLLGRGRQQQHEAAGQLVGTGFPRSRNCLYRELNRRVEWIFSNDAVYLQGIVNALCDGSPSP